MHFTRVTVDAHGPENPHVKAAGDLRTETDRNPHNVRVVARCTDGVDPVGEFELGGASLVQLRWRPGKHHVALQWKLDAGGTTEMAL
jgi:hypothetical protein